MDLAKNFAKGTLSTGYTSAATSVVLTGGHGARFPTVPFNAAWWNLTDYPDPSDDPNVEIVRVTARSTDTLTITRAQEGTTATNKNTVGKTYALMATFTADMWNTQLVGALGFFLPIFTTALYSPLDGQTVFLGMGFDPTTVAGVRRVRVPKTGRIIAAFLDATVYTTAGSGESTAVSVRVNNTTDVSVNTGLLHNALIPTNLSVSNLAMNQAVTAGDYIEMKLVYPTFVTNPVNVVYHGSVFIRPD